MSQVNTEVKNKKKKKLIKMKRFIHTKNNEVGRYHVENIKIYFKMEFKKLK